MIKFVLILVLVVGCFQKDQYGCGINDSCHLIKIRNRFIRLPVEQREKEREWCKNHQYCSIHLHREPTPEELEKLEDEKEK